MGWGGRLWGEGQRLWGRALGGLCRGAAALLGLGGFPRLHSLLLALLVALGPALRARGDPRSLLASPHNLLEARLTSSAAPWTALFVASLLVAAHPLLRPPVGVAFRAAARLAVALLLARAGPALFRRLEAAIGSCWATPTPMGTLLLPHPDPESCRGAGHEWVGFSPAPQAFGLVYAGLGLAEEAAWIGRGLWGGRGRKRGRGLREGAGLPGSPPVPPPHPEWEEPRWEGEEWAWPRRPRPPPRGWGAWPPPPPSPPPPRPARFWAEKPPFWAGRARSGGFGGPEVGRGGPEVGWSGPEVGRSAPEVGWSAPEVGRFSPEVGWSRPEVGRFSPEVGWSRPEVGRFAPEVGVSEPEAAGFRPDPRGPEPGAALCLLYLLNVGLLALWHVLLAVTLAYRHTWARNAAGAALGWAAWGLTYRAWFRWAWPGWG